MDAIEAAKKLIKSFGPDCDASAHAVYVQKRYPPNHPEEGETVIKVHINPDHPHRYLVAPPEVWNGYKVEREGWSQIYGQRA